MGRTESLLTKGICSDSLLWTGKDLLTQRHHERSVQDQGSTMTAIYAVGLDLMILRIFSSLMLQFDCLRTCSQACLPTHFRG